MSWVCCVLSLVCGGEPGEYWPGFRGAEATRPPARSLPVAWAPDRNVAWRAALAGRGVSEPVVWRDRVFVSSVTAAPEEGLRIHALNLKTGEPTWARRFDADRPIRLGADFANAASTPVVDLERVYVLFEAGELLALSHDGEPRWRRDLGRDYGRVRLEAGLAASLAQDEASVFALVDHDGRSYLAAFDKRTGATRWKCERPNGASWSSPVCSSIDGVPQVVVSSAGTIDGYDVLDGRRLWHVEDVVGNIAPSPVRASDGLFLIGACLAGKGERLLSAIQSNGAIRVRRREREWQVDVNWRTDGAACSYASPAVHDGCGYWVDEQGNVTCLDVATGKAHYSETLGEPCWASPLAFDDRVYLFGVRGTTTVLAGGPKFRVLARNRLAAPDGSDRSLASSLPYAVAAVRGSLLIRTAGELVCVRDVETAARP